MIWRTLRGAALIFLAAALIVGFLRLPARLTIELFHTIIAMPLSLGIVLLAVAVFLVLGIHRFARWLLAGARSRNARIARAQTALARSHVAMIAGDHARALRESARALNLMPEHTAGGLILQAEAAELDGDDALAQSAYEQLAQASETRFLGLRGQLRMALKSGDRARAYPLARESFQLRPDSDWAADILVALSAGSGDIDIARQTIDRALKSRAYDLPRAKRRRALIHYFESEAQRAQGVSEKALAQAREAHELCPDHIGFASTAAAAEAKAGAAERGVRILEETYAKQPHPALVDCLSEIFADDPPALRKSRIAALVRRRGDHLESRLALGEAALNAGDLAEAKRALAPLGGASSFRGAVLAARLARELGEGGESAGRREAAQLFEAAKHLPHDDQWACSECRAQQSDWTPLCPQCGALDSWIWPDRRAEQSSPDDAARPALVDPTPRLPDDPGIEHPPATRLVSWRKLLPWMS